MEKQWIQIGTVGKPYGLKGQFFLSGREGLFEGEVNELRVGMSLGSSVSFSLSSVCSRGGRQLINLKGLQDRGQCAALVHQKIWVKREELTITDDEFYFCDLEGKDVISSKGDVIGKVTGVDNFGASDVIEINNSDVQTLMLPFTNQYFDMIESIDGPKVVLTVDCELVEDLWTASKRSPYN